MFCCEDTEQGLGLCRQDGSCTNDFTHQRYCLPIQNYLRLKCGKAKSGDLKGDNEQILKRAREDVKAEGHFMQRIFDDKASDSIKIVMAMILEW